MTIKDKMKCPCKNCVDKPYNIDGLFLELLEQLEMKVAERGMTVIYLSGLRCPVYNKIAGGVPDSPHIYGEAEDIRVAGMDLIDLAKLCIEIGFKRIGIYPNHIHVDVVTPKPSKFWYVKKYGTPIIYSKNINDLDEFLKKVR